MKILWIICLFLAACAKASPPPPAIERGRDLAATGAKQMSEGQVYKASPKDVFSALTSMLLENGFIPAEENEETLFFRTEPKKIERWAAFFPSRPNQYWVDLQIEAQVEQATPDSSRARLNVQYIGPQNTWEPIQEAQFYNFLYGEIGRTLRKLAMPPKPKTVN